MLVSYQLEDSIAKISMDDGKVNVLSRKMLAELNSAFDRAESDRAVVVLTGRGGLFSAGFDLTALRGGGEEASAMLREGFELAERMLSFPTPVVIACSGHAIAMAVFLLLSGDFRIGAAGPYKITANEVAIGLAMPQAAVEICRQRVPSTHFNRVVALAEVFSPEEAVGAGLLDRTAPESDLGDAAAAMAAQLGKLDMQAHTASKLRVREGALKALRTAIEADWGSTTPAKPA